MKKKIIRIMTSDISLDSFGKGQLKFLNKEFNVIGVSNNTGLLEEIGEREGIRTIEVPMCREISLLSDIKCLWKLYCIFKREKPDIVHANTPKGSLLAMIAGKVAGVKHRIYLVTGLRYEGASGIFRALLMMMERVTCYFATKVIPEGRGVLNTLQKDKITSKPLKVILNGNINGIDTSYFSNEAVGISRKEMRQKLCLLPNDFTFIFIGRIVRDKGINELIACMKELRGKCKLIIVGSFELSKGTIYKEYEAFFNENKDILYVGSQKDVRPYLLASDALVFPSYREGFPNVVMEAGAMGLPSIVTDINGSNEIIEDGVNGVIIPSKSAIALLKAMNLFIQNKNKVEQLAACAREKICNRYERRDLWNALLAMYKELL